MHGITHFYRQHAVEKQLSGGGGSTDSWTPHNNGRSAYSYGNNEASSMQTHHLYSADSSSSSSSNSNNSNNSALGGVTGSAYAQWQTERHSQPQAVPDALKSLANHHHQYGNSPTHQTNGGGQNTSSCGPRNSYDSCYTSGSGISGSLKRTPSSKRSFFERSHSPAIYGVSNGNQTIPCSLLIPLYTAAHDL